MSLYEKINKIRGFFLDLIFPKTCLACKQEGSYLCQQCLEKIPLTDKLICPLCQKITSYGQTCKECQRKTYLNGLFYATSYKNPIINQAIKLFKYKYVKKLAFSLAQIIAKLIKNSNFFINNFSENYSHCLIVPTPLHRKKFLWRGFNQSELLAKYIAEEFNFKLKNDCLIKTKNTRSQTELKQEMRKTNVRNTLAVKNKKEIKNKIIFLVDDVFTTGATLNEAARVLKKAGAKKVWAIVLAKD